MPFLLFIRLITKKRKIILFRDNGAFSYQLKKTRLPLKKRKASSSGVLKGKL